MSGHPSRQIDFSLERRPWTWANLVTVVRAIGGTAVFAFAASTDSAGWNYAGLLIYWMLDILDGYLARALHQETRLGAQMDILADRLLMAFFYLNYVSLNPEAMLPVSLFLFSFMGLDNYLSNQFLRWPILSANYFSAVDHRLWALNWSPAGKALNSGLVTILLIAFSSPWPATAAATAIIAVKTHSCVRLHQLRQPERNW